MARRKALVQEIAEISAKHVLSESTRNALDKIAEDFARDLRSDPAYRAYIKQEATAAVREFFAALREPLPEPRGVKKKSRRRGRAVGAQRER